MSVTKIIKRTILLLVGPLVIGVVSAWIYLMGGRYITTENAYIKAEIVTLSSEISGKVSEVYVEDNQRIERGEVLIELYDEPQRISLARAEANLATVCSELKSLQAEYISKQIDESNAETKLRFQERELERLQRLLVEESISASQFEQAEFARDNSAYELQSRKQSLEITAIRLINPNAPIEHHPRYLQAQSDVDNAKLDLSYTKVKAPISGIATNIAARVGENILSGTNLLNLIQDDKLWVEANLKETDLTYVRTGQSATVRIDTYPDLEWTAHVESITPATGSEFALLPAQNSSGNWVKVVQRIMVKLVLDKQHSSVPLSAGMSSAISIDSGHVRTIPWLSESLTTAIREF